MTWKLMNDVFPAVGESALILARLTPFDPPVEPEDPLIWPVTATYVATFQGDSFYTADGQAFIIGSGEVLAFKLIPQPTDEEINAMLTQIYGAETPPPTP